MCGRNRRVTRSRVSGLCTYSATPMSRIKWRYRPTSLYSPTTITFTSGVQTTARLSSSARGCGTPEMSTINARGVGSLVRYFMACRIVPRLNSIPSTVSRNPPRSAASDSSSPMNATRGGLSSDESRVGAIWGTCNTPVSTLASSMERSFPRRHGTSGFVDHGNVTSWISFPLITLICAVADVAPLTSAAETSPP